MLVHFLADQDSCRSYVYCLQHYPLRSFADFAQFSKTTSRIMNKRKVPAPCRSTDVLFPTPPMNKYIYDTDGGHRFVMSLVVRLRLHWIRERHLYVVTRAI